MLVRARDRQRQQHALRMRRYRRRQAAGSVSITTDLSIEETAKLCQLRYLSEAQVEDRQCVAEALHALIANITLDP